LQTVLTVTKVDDPTFGYGSDVTYDTVEETYSNLISNVNVELTPSFASSTSSTTPITYSLDSSSPSWVTIDSSTGVLTIDTTGVSAGTVSVFNMLAKVSISSVTESKQITLEVEQCSPNSNGGCEK